MHSLNGSKYGKLQWNTYKFFNLILIYTAVVVNWASYHEHKQCNLWGVWTLEILDPSIMKGSSIIFCPLGVHPHIAWDARLKLPMTTKLKVQYSITPINGEVQVHFSTFDNHYCSTFWNQNITRSFINVNHLVHGDACNPSILLEDFLHVSFYNLERVQVPNKNPAMQY